VQRQQRIAAPGAILTNPASVVRRPRSRGTTLALWLAVPLIIGVWRFARRDVN
jgi:hypothetical protein